MNNQTRVALVTGGARGIGAAIVEHMAREGVKVLAADILDEEGEALAKQLQDDGLDVRYKHLDVTQEAEWTATIETAEAAFGAPVNVLINNAGIVVFSGVSETKTEDWNRIIDINLTGVFFGTRAIVDSMKRAGGGVIVNISSTAGMMGYSGIAGYVASKWGVRGLTKASALDLAPLGVRVVSVYPGPIRTPMTSDMDEETAQSQPIPRFGEPEEVAEMTWFLVANATYSTGSEFVIDGGAVTGQLLQGPQEG